MGLAFEVPRETTALAVETGDGPAVATSQGPELGAVTINVPN